MKIYFSKKKRFLVVLTFKREKELGTYLKTNITNKRRRVFILLKKILKIPIPFLKIFYFCINVVNRNLWILKLMRFYCTFNLNQVFFNISAYGFRLDKRIQSLIAHKAHSKGHCYIEKLFRFILLSIQHAGSLKERDN